MEILLLILKIIGIVLLSVIGLVLFLLLLILLMPIRYSGVAAMHDKPDIHFKASYLFIIKARGDFTDKLTYSVKAAWITIMSGGDDGSHKKDKSSKKKKGEEASETASDSVKESTAPESGDVACDKEKASAGEITASAETDTNEIYTWGDLADEEEELDKKALKARKKAEKKAAKEAKKAEKAEKKAAKKAAQEAGGEKEEKGPGFFDKIHDLVVKYLDKAEAAIRIADEGKQDVETFFKRKSTKYAIEKIKKALIKILKHICPRKMSGELEFGLEDPSQTGMILGAVSAFYITDDKFVLKPNFDEKVIKGRFEFKGHILLGVIVYHALALYLRKQVRMFIHNAQELKDSTMERVDDIKNVFVTSES